MNSLLSCFNLAMECNRHPVLISNIFKLKPAVVVAYNKTMGGEDILSRLIRDYSPIADSVSMRLFMEHLSFALRNMYAVNQFIEIKNVDNLMSIKKRNHATAKGGYQRFLLNLPIPEFYTVLSRDNTNADDINDSETTLVLFKIRKRKKNSTDHVLIPKIVAEHSSLFLTPTKMTPRKISQEFSVPKRYKNDAAAIQLERDRRENCMGVPMFSCVEKEPKSKSQCSYCHKSATP
eukprot:Pgem_evm1s3136